MLARLSSLFALLAASAIALSLAVAAPLSAQNAATTVAIDANANKHAINPNIYGLGGGPSEADIKALNAPLNRIGGNNTSDYNWEQDALNLDNDYYYESFLQDGPPIVAGASYDNTILATHNAGVGSEPMITIPMLPYIAKVQSNAASNAASLWSYSVAKYGAQQSVDPYQTDAGNGVLTNGTNVVNDPTDAYTTNSVSIEQGLVQHLVSKWGLSSTTNGVKYYVLDNEPSLWNSTHRDIHPNPETYEEEYNNIVNYATAIRAVDPNAKIVGPEEWIWWAMWESGLDQKNGTGTGSDYATHNNTYYYPWLLQQLYAYQQSSGVKMLDVLSVHCYTDADSSQYNVTTRELWDPKYQDPNWEGANGVDLNGGVLNWIPLMKQWVNQYYPGLQIGCTEYDWGDANSLGGATAQADALGIFGLYGFDLATNWGVPPTPGYLSMQMYRNYDGKLSTFGDTSVASTVVNPDNLSAFASVRSSDKALTVVVINKQTGTTPVTVNVANFANTGTATAYQISSASQTSINNLGSVTITSNAITFTAPSQSVTLFVVPASEITGPVVSLSATSLVFANQNVGTTSGSQAVTLTNTGNASLTIASIAVTGTNASSYGFANNCGSTLAAGANCSIHGHFAPTTAGALPATITVTDDASDSPQTISLSGTGLGPAAVSLSPTSLSFGTVNLGGSSASQSVTLTNTGSGTLAISSIAVTGADASSYAFSNSCGASLSAGANCTIHGHFAPTQAGSLPATISIADNAAGSPQSVALTGTGEASPIVSLSATSLKFSAVNVGSSSASQTVTLTNTGTGPLSITSIAVTGASASSFTFANSCGTSVAAGGNCTIHGHFTPATAGALMAAVTITENAGNSPQAIALSGTGNGPPTVSLSTTSLSFGTVKVGSASASMAVTLTNTGTGPLAISSISVAGENASSFSFANTCGSTLAAGANCSVHGHFAPAASGSLTAAITISDNATGSPQTIALSGTGQ